MRRANENMPCATFTMAKIIPPILLVFVRRNELSWELNLQNWAHQSITLIALANQSL
ncbi:hypothetical protein SLEP1_g20107 [Rubroshorea leprosula]|uniref:Uncharacterized protein n=1 Tax=Rubroshorea leprosula TaxID=152421 RepID=A0AAV5JC38_9ROSI|nr:hypothetical protein SLEP1_g20107 [Rubroshorea leprosula]